MQSDAALWHPFRKFGDGTDRDGNCRIVVKARVCLSSSAHFDSVKLVLSDLSADNSSRALSADFKASAGGAWYEATLCAGGTDVGGWSNDLACGIEAFGKSLGDGDDFATHIRVRWIAVEQWVD